MLIESFIEDSNRAGTPEQLFSLYLASMHALGFDRVIFSLMSDHAAIGRAACHGIARNYPSDWMSHYVSVGYQDVDPVRQRIMVSDRPFFWSELPRTRRLTDGEQAVMDGGQEAGLNDGIGIPLRGARGAIAGVGAASSSKGVARTLSTLCQANLLAQQFYLAYLELCSSAEVAAPVTLSSREREILEWVAAGRTKSEIGEILSISHHTVDYHTRKVLQKLGAPNLTVALLGAIKLGLVRI